mgnify:CR=1 FL=1
MRDSALFGRGNLPAEWEITSPDFVPLANSFFSYQEVMKIYLDIVGCRLNQAEIERYARQFRSQGHTLVPSPAEADLAVLNTCDVTSAAASDSRHKTRQINRAGTPEVFLTGCWATLNPETAASLPGVTRVISNEEKDDLVPNLLDIPPEKFDLEPIQRQPVPGARLRTRAFIKAQDGCHNQCTFCITTVARGSARSRTIAEIVADIQAVSEGATKEAVLTGVHLGSWGFDLSPKLKLADLVRAALKHTSLPRLRLSSVEPWDLDADFYRLWEDPRLCRQLHLPLQSGSAPVLKRMARQVSPREYRNIVETARQAVPDMAITTDIITGFPGESEAEFSESLDYIREMNFAGGHVFTYSARPGTPAARLPEQVPHPVRKARNEQVRGVLESSSREYRARFVGSSLPVLWENAAGLGPDGWQVSGLTDNYLRVFAHTNEDVWNQITNVKLVRRNERGLVGEIL